jgi:hypothetical protein
MKEVSVIACKMEERKLACECYLITLGWTCGKQYAYSNTWDYYSLEQLSLIQKDIYPIYVYFVRSQISKVTRPFPIIDSKHWWNNISMYII